MTIISHLRAILTFVYDLYTCGEVPWILVSTLHDSYSVICGKTATHYFHYGCRTTHHARRATGGILLHATLPQCRSAMVAAKPCIYLIFSLFHHHRYIGRTLVFARRRNQHFQTAVRALVGSQKPKVQSEFQRVHRAIKDLGITDFCMLPICTTQEDQLRRLERLIIHRLQPSLNVSGTTRRAHPFPLPGQQTQKRQRITSGRPLARATARRRLQLDANPSPPTKSLPLGKLVHDEPFTRLPPWLHDRRILYWRRELNPGYAASRLRTAYKHVMKGILGIAMPPRVGRLCVSRLNTAAPVLQLRQRHLALPIHRSQRFSPAILFSSCPPLDQATAFLPVFRITTPYEIIASTNLVQDWPLLLKRCPVEQYVHGFCATLCVIQLLDIGTLTSPYHFRSICRYIWTPLVLASHKSQPTSIVPLSTGLRQLLTGTSVCLTCVFTTLALKGNVDDILLLYDIGRNPIRTKWILRHHTPDSVLALWHKTHIVRSKPWKTTTRNCLLQHMRQMWNFNPKTRPVVRVPTISAKGAETCIKQFIRTIFESLPLPASLRALLLQQHRVTALAVNTVGQLLCNHIKFAKQVESTSPACSCRELKNLLRPLDNDDTIQPGQHFGQRGIEAQNEDFAFIFRTHSMSLPHPTSQDFDSFVYRTTRSAFRTARTWAGKLLSPPPADEFDIALAEAAGGQTIPQWTKSGRIRSIIEFSMQSGSIPSHNLWEEINILRTNLTRTAEPPPDSIPSLEQIEATKTKLANIAIISPLDRNPGCLFVQCPAGYFTSLQAHFSIRGGYNTSNMDQRGIIDLWKKIGEDLRMPGKFNHTGSIPYGYITTKHKDISRVRPIVSFADAPHRRHLFHCARALAFMLQSIKHPTFTLWEAWKATSATLAAQESLLLHPLSQTEDVAIIGAVYDIKDMYTALEHRDINTAVAWAMTAFCKQLRRKSVHMARTGRTDGCTGPLYAKSTRVLISCDMISSYTCSILQAGFLQCGDKLLQQTIGIPMGNPLSPALAIAVCMYAEARWLSTQVQRPVTGLRYMDDILMMTLDSTPNYATTAPNFYPASLRVLPASTEQPLQFLETLLAWVGTVPVFNYNNRNRHQSSIMRFRHGDSFTSKSSLRSLVQCMFRRGAQFPSNLGFQLQAVLELACEFHKLHYSLKLLREAAFRLKNRDPLRATLWSIVLWCFRIIQ